MGKKKIRINFFSRLQSKKSTPPSLDGGILIKLNFTIMEKMLTKLCGIGFIVCATNACFTISTQKSSMQKGGSEFLFAHPDKGIKKTKQGIPADDNDIDAFEPGLNIRIHCGICHTKSNHAWGFKGSLGQQNTGFDMSYIIYASKCQACGTAIQDTEPDEEDSYIEFKSKIRDIVFSRCNFEWNGLTKYILVGRKKRKFEKPPVYLKGRYPYLIFSNEHFMTYRYGRIRVEKRQL